MDRHIHSNDAGTTDLRVTKAELTMARRIDGRFEVATRTAAFAALLITYVVMTIVGVWLRTLTIPRGWEVVAACALVAVLAWVCPQLSWVFGRKPPGWVTSAEICERALADRIPGPTMEVVSQVIDTIRSRGRRRWHGANVYLSRCTSTEPPDTGVCQTAGVVPLNGRLVVVLGEHMASGLPVITRAVLAHESRHVRPVRMYLTWLSTLSRLAGWVIIGWAVPGPALLLALLAFHVAATLLSWVIEISCDLGGAAETGVDAMLATLHHLSETSAQTRRQRSRWGRYTRDGLIWLAGPTHPPLPLRRMVIWLRRPHASSL